ncbi:hypothetical protein AQUCO_03700273v1 [Aquilegia coerulea]|uniref:RRM domain-containing protein n=1 Tax=Aquilegia coerulea TaxID=218851 RepID=A0A2G5CUD8_AQUCA|nr:hypothetical protein AQUCO_03700273v1 [Aquilegia coerulea]
MAVVENASVDLGISSVNSSNRNLETATQQQQQKETTDKNNSNNNNNNNSDLDEESKKQNYSANRIVVDQAFPKKVQQFQQNIEMNNNNNSNGVVNGRYNFGGYQQQQQQIHQRSNGDVNEGFKRDIKDLEELLSKLNPMAEEFVPPSLVNGGSAGNFYVNNFMMMSNKLGNGNLNGRRKNNYTQGKRRMNSRTSMAQREEVIRRTVYVSDIDQQVTEEQLAALFINCGQVVDCRICGDPNSVLRFAFIEFTDEEGARNALSLAGTMLGFYPVRVLPSKTAIAPVNPTFLPRSEDEREMCARTIYCTNIDKKVTQADVKSFFESICGEVYRLRLLGDYHHSTRIAFVEFVMAESAIAALSCSGVVLGSLPIRVSPSKTPVRPRAPRAPMH